MSNNTSLDVFEYTGRGQTIPKDVVSVRFHQSVVEVEEKAFEDCKQLKEVILNDGLREIGEEAFHHCESLQSIAIPSTVKEIDVGAFYGCTELRKVVFNEGLQKIGRAAFAFCYSLECTLPSTVTEIDSFAFHDCRSLREIVLKEGRIDMIGEHAFRNCFSLERITIPSSVVEIEEFAFCGCNLLREVVIHNEKVQMGETSFGGCTSLERFKFPSLSTRLDNIIQAGQRDIEPKMDDIPLVEWRGGELIIPTVQRQIRSPYSMEITEVDKEKLNKVKGLISYYELKEATTMFELALWKARIDQVEDANDVNRNACRIEVPGPVKDAVLAYLL